VAFTEAELLSLNALYKSRWPSMENELKALQSQGFGRNRMRRLELVVSRGTDGEVARLREREARWRGKVRELEAEPVSGKGVGRLIAAAGKVEQARAKQAVVVAAAPLKHARVEAGAERLGKWLHLLVYNAMSAEGTPARRSSHRERQSRLPSARVSIDLSGERPERAVPTGTQSS
jgi:hypothetical protein